MHKFIVIGQDILINITDKFINMVVFIIIRRRNKKLNDLLTITFGNLGKFIKILLVSIDYFSRYRIPYSECLIPTSADYSWSVRTKWYWVYPITMTRECVDYLSCYRIPYSNSLIITSADYSRSIRTKWYWPYRTTMTRECVDYFARSRIPYSDSIIWITTSADYSWSIRTKWYWPYLITMAV